MFSEPLYSNQLIESIRAESVEVILPLNDYRCGQVSEGRDEVSGFRILSEVHRFELHTLLLQMTLRGVALRATGLGVDSYQFRHDEKVTTKNSG